MCLKYLVIWSCWLMYESCPLSHSSFAAGAGDSKAILMYSYTYLCQSINCKPKDRCVFVLVTQSLSKLHVSRKLDQIHTLSRTSLIKTSSLGSDYGDWEVGWEATEKEGIIIQPFFCGYVQETWQKNLAIPNVRECVLPIPKLFCGVLESGLKGCNNLVKINVSVME